MGQWVWLVGLLLPGVARESQCNNWCQVFNPSWVCRGCSVHGGEFYNHMLIINYFFQCLLSIHWKPGSLGHTTKIKGTLPCSWSGGAGGTGTQTCEYMKWNKTKQNWSPSSWGLLWAAQTRVNKINYACWGQLEPSCELRGLSPVKQHLEWTKVSCFFETGSQVTWSLILAHTGYHSVYLSEWCSRQALWEILTSMPHFLPYMVLVMILWYLILG